MFEGIAHEALSECMRSLQFASDAIKNKKVNNLFFGPVMAGAHGLSVCH